MSDLNAFRHETRDWLEANCPPSMRESTQGGEEMCWGGRNFEFASEEQKQWMERMGAKGWTAPVWPAEYGGGGELRLLLQGVSEHLYTEEPALSDEGEVGGLRVLTSWPLSRAAGPLGGAAEEHAWDMRGERPPVTVASIRLSSGRKPALLACRVGRGAAIAGAHRRHGFHSDAGGEKGGVGQPRN